MFGVDLSSKQIVGLVGISAMISVTDALIIRHLGHRLFKDDRRQLGTYLASIPTGYGMLVCTQRLLQINRRQQLASASLMAATMLMIDGIGVMWFAKFYENPELARTNSYRASLVSRMGGAWLLWGIGGSLACALLH